MTTQGQEELPEGKGMTFNSTFTGMPRMNALFRKLVADGIITESSINRSKETSGNRKIQSVSDVQNGRDTEVNTD